MRVTGGAVRGRNIISPSGRGVRPTASKVRQALFNILSSRVNDAHFLDICAGSGLVGLEAMSRGAAALTVIEQNRPLAQAIQASGQDLGYPVRAFGCDFKRALPLLQGEKFDIIFADPPYKSASAQTILEKISEYELLETGGRLIVEHLKKLELELGNVRLEFIDTRLYGQTALSFFTC
jgi:16S rRNA (guanine(966)-N(2))-methyltransferase RsmD